MATLTFPIGLRRLAAAARLAVLYVVGVLVLVLPVELTSSSLPISQQLREAGVVFGVFFAIAFAILAVARRAGFAALWGILLLLWTRSILDGHSVLAIPNAFVYWSFLALPLFALGALGAAGASRVIAHGWKIPSWWSVPVVWVVLAAAAMKWGWIASDMFVEGAPYRAVGLAAQVVWAPAPFLLAVSETARVWIATRPAKIDALAA